MEKETEWSSFATVYDPLKIASIDGTDVIPHDKAVIRAINSTYKPNERVKGIPERTIFIGRLNLSTEEESVRKLCAECGKVVRCRLVRDLVTGKSRRYAFVEFEQEREARRACRQLHKTVLDGREILVDMEMERTLPGWKPRRLGGGFGGRKESGQLRFGCKDRKFKKPVSLLSKQWRDGDQAEFSRSEKRQERDRDERSRFVRHHRHEKHPQDRRRYS